MRLRRKQDSDEPLEGGAVEQDEAATGTAVLTGPIDVSEMAPEAVFIDLGSLLVSPPAGLDLRMQVHEETGLMTVLLVGEDGILEVRAFAASRSGDLWEDARREIAADTVTRGGTAVDQEGSFGTELYCEVPVADEQGNNAIQPSRVIGCPGPRWFVRATIAGAPAQDQTKAGPYEDALRALAVRRGNEAMAPGDPLPLRLPPEARQVTAEDLA